MAYWIDKVIDELRWKSCGKYDVDNIMWMIDHMKHPPMPPMPDAEVVEIEVEEIPDEESKGFWKPEEAELPTSNTSSDKDEENSNECKKEEPCNSSSEESLEAPTPAEQDRMDEVLKAIKTIYPNENTEDVLVRMVSKLIWL